MADLVPASLVAHRFRLIEAIGEGGFATVWRATDLTTGADVAVKFLSRLSRVEQDRFEREVTTLQRLDHPLCVRLIASGVHEATPFAVTEYVEGVTLRRWMASRRALDVVVDVARQIAVALDAAHRTGVTHRDLKPRNIVVTERPDGRVAVKVLDFGIAKLAWAGLTDITKTGELIGTPGFMSPEQLRGQKTIGPSSDLFNLGLILFELIEGRPPFTGSSGLEVAMATLTSPPPPLGAHSPPRLTMLVGRLLEKDPGRRPMGAAAVVAEFDRWREPLTSTALPSLSASTAPPRTKPAAAWVAVLAVFFAIAALVFYTRTKTDEAPPPPSGIRANNPLVAAPARPTSNVDAGARVGLDQGQLHDTDAPTSSSCAQMAPLPPGDHVLAADIEVTVRVPQDYDPARRYPVILFFHDGWSGPADALAMIDADATPLVNDYVVVAPRDPTVVSPWQNRGRISASLASIELVGEQVCIDPSRIYALGHGSGGNAARELPCMSASIRAVATPSSGRNHRPLCILDPPVPYLLTGSTKDPLDPLLGGLDCLQNAKPSYEDEVNKVEVALGCNPGRGSSRKYTDGKCETKSCDAEFVSCIVDGGRPWKGPTIGFARLVGCSSEGRNFPYTKVIWEFFARSGPQ